MPDNVLITGGAGFIGSHLCDSLIAKGHSVTVLDSLHPQIHGVEQTVPAYLNPQVRFVKGDVRDEGVVCDQLRSADIVFHLAAHTGVGQSMYQIREYADVNVTGTGTLLQGISKGGHRVRKLVLASSRAVYGEGACLCEACGVACPRFRSKARLERGHWTVDCERCGNATAPIPTPETSVLRPGSIYAVSKLAQEQASLLTGKALGIPVVALRFFNVYGTRQSLENPYTGIMCNFVARLLNGKAPEVYEDGCESRDFVHVSDVVRACILALERDSANGEVLNVGSGLATTVLEIAELLADELDGPAPVITGKFRLGDVRHCHADLTHVRSHIGYIPRIDLRHGIKEFVETTRGQVCADRSGFAEAELRQRGLAARAS